MGGERSHPRAFRVGCAGEYDRGERRGAMSVCLVPGSAGDGVLRGGLGGWAGADNGNSALVEASKRALHRWDARLTLAV